jgi:DNA-binding NarL/FixJ family response regulator
MTNPLRVLVVDDSPEFANAAVAFLTEVGEFRLVGMVHTGEEALRVAELESPDLVLLDFKMPRMDGIETMRRIKAGANPPRVVMVSLFDDESLRERALNSGADGFIAKGTVCDALLPVIRDLFPEATARPDSDPAAKP